MVQSDSLLVCAEMYGTNINTHYDIKLHCHNRGRYCEINVKVAFLNVFIIIVVVGVHCDI
jgi:hypothetical protein